MAAREFLGKHNVHYESLDIGDPASALRWEEAGSPVVPSLVVDGAVTPILHASQIASALGLPAEEGLEAARLAWDLASVLDAWAGHLDELDWEHVLVPTPSRGRTLRNLTVNVFCPVGLLPTAWTRGVFAWNPDEDPIREARLTSMRKLVAYAEGIRGAWNSFLLGAEEELAVRNPEIESPRGSISYHDLLASQRWHAAYHYRQLVEFVAARGLPSTVRPLEVDRFADLDLPQAVF